MTRLTLLAAALLAAGCSKPPRPPKATTDSEPVAAAKPSAPGPAAIPGPAVAPAANPDDFARRFLTAVRDGNATPALLTPEFKKVIAEPVFPDDKAKGYSEDAAAEWLRRFKDGPALEAGRYAAGPVGGASLYMVGAAGPPRIHTGLRLVPAGDSFLVDWFFPAKVDPAMKMLAEGDAAACGFAAGAFLDALLAKEDATAEGLMTPAYKAALAPPFGSDARGYNRGTLAAKLAGFRGTFTGYALNPPAAGVVSGTLRAGDRMKNVTLRLAKGPRAWDWLVEEFKE